MRACVCVVCKSVCGLQKQWIMGENERNIVSFLLTTDIKIQIDAVAVFESGIAKKGENCSEKRDR